MDTFYLDQKNDSTCVAVAIINVCFYLKIDSPDLEDLIDRLHCRHGGAIGTDLVIRQVFGNRLTLCDNFREFSKTGGILTIVHPIFNFHAVFCYPQGEGFTLVNSWLGPNVINNIGYEEITKFFPKFQHQQEFWKIGEHNVHRKE